MDVFLTLATAVLLLLVQPPLMRAFPGLQRYALPRSTRRRSRAWHPFTAQRRAERGAHPLADQPYERAAATQREMNEREAAEYAAMQARAQMQYAYATQERALQMQMQMANTQCERDAQVAALGRAQSHMQAAGLGSLFGPGVDARDLHAQGILTAQTGGLYVDPTTDQYYRARRT